MLVLALAMVVFLVMAWSGIGDDLQRPFWGLAGRLHYTLVTVIAVGLVWFCYYWHLFA
jgi:hypothetical protein